MNSLKHTGILFLCIILLSGCGGKSKNHSRFSFFSKSELKEHYPDFDEKILSDSIRAYFAGTSETDVFYQKNSHVPLWTKDIFDSPELDSLVAYLGRSGNHGVNPEIFRHSKIKRLVDTIRTGAFSKEMPVLYHHLTRLEQLATKAFVDYNTGLRYGFVNPKKEFPDSYYISVQRPDSNYYAVVFSEMQKDPVHFLKESQPRDSVYLKLQKALSIYGGNESMEEIPQKNKANYKIHDVDKTVFPLIAKRLMITGELPEVDHPDSIYSSLTPDLLKAVNLFRRQNSYPEDDAVGEPTINALNRPMSYYGEKIRANLERLRWKKEKPAGNKFVEVNVAAFMLKAIEPGAKPLLMNVCVGKAGTNQTPLLESEIYYINLNPDWNVPFSIVEKEIYGLVQKKPDYLRRHRMKLLDKGGKEVNPEAVDWNTLNPKKFPYRIRQDSGEGNSLGRIKFMFKNSFAVYLHDTPSKGAFSYRNRAISHGCVRVQKPIDLSFFLLEKKDSTYLDRILISIDKTPLSQEGRTLFKKGQLKKLDNVVRLSPKVPVYIDYFTSYVLPDGMIYFADDVYGFDKKIMEIIG